MIEVTEAMIDAAAGVLFFECDPPYMARVNDFTDAQIEAGELRAADRAAHQKNRDLVRRALVAALATKE